MANKTITDTISGLEEFAREELIEQHLQLEHIISREKRLRREAEGLLEGLRTLNTSRNAQEMFENLLAVLTEFIPIENGFIIFEQENGELRVGMTTHPAFSSTRWENSKFIQRILSGQVIAAHNVHSIPAWQQPLKLDHGPRTVSALHAPLHTQNHRAILVCTHSEPAKFNKKHVRLLEKFSPLTNQALANIEYRQELETAVNRQTKELRIAKENAELANQTKSRFLANISHEIRTPMNAIINFNILALEGNLPAPEREYIEKATSASKGLLAIINETLDLSKIEAGKLTIESTPFKLDRLINEVVDLFKTGAEEKGLTFNTELSYPNTMVVVGDPLRLRQVLTNLIHNAIKFTDSGGIRILVSAQPVKHNRTTIFFAVNDSGIGLSESELKSIFQPFQQADNSITRKYGGTGLGLAISNQLLGLMGSKISVRSTPNVGSRFSFSLNLNTVKTVEDSPHSALPTTDSSEKKLSALKANILLVEDNATNQLIAKKILERINLCVTVAGNGKEALALLNSFSFDLILMDIHMPVMDGFQAATAIRDNPQWDKLPIIALTANATQSTIEACNAAGMSAHIPKPIDIKTMYKVILDELTAAEERSQ